MKNLKIFSLLLASVAIYGCIADARDDRMPDTTVYFVDNAVRNDVMTFNIYDVQKEEVNVPVYVYCSGFREATPEVSAIVDESYIEYYNACYVPVSKEPLKVLPAECYTIDTAPVTVANRKATINVAFNPEKIFAYAKENRLSYDDMKRYAAPIKLQCESLEIATYKDTASLGYCLVAPVMNDALVQMEIEKIDAVSYDVVVSVPFNNTLDITYDLQIGKSEVVSAEAGEFGNHYPAKVRLSALPEGTVVTNKDVRSMEPGTNEVRYAITFPEGSAGKFPVSLTNVVGNGDEMPIEGGEQVIDLSTLDLYATSNGQAKSNYPSGFASDEQTLVGTTLNKYGLTAYADDKNYIFHPQSTCQYGGRDMCVGANSVFSGDANDWGVGFLGDHSAKNLTDDGKWNGSLAAYGYNTIKRDGVLWLLVDMGKVQSVAGLEYWRKCGDGDQNAAAVQTMEFYALDDCEYVRYNPILTWEDADATYLGSASFGDDVTKNVLATTWESIDTQYLMVLLTGKKADSFACIEMDIFHK